MKVTRASLVKEVESCPVGQSVTISDFLLVTTNAGEKIMEMIKRSGYEFQIWTDVRAGAKVFKRIK